MLTPRRWIVPLLAREIPSFVLAQTVCDPADSQFLHRKSCSYFDIALKHNFEEVVYFLGWPNPKVHDVIWIADNHNSVRARLTPDQITKYSWLDDLTPGSILCVKGSGVRISDCYDPPRIELHNIHLAKQSGSSSPRSIPEFPEAHKTRGLKKILAVCLQKQAEICEEMSTRIHISVTSTGTGYGPTMKAEILDDEDQLQSQFLTQLPSAQPPNVNRQPLAPIENSNHEKRSLLSLLKPDSPRTTSPLSNRSAEEPIRASHDTPATEDVETPVTSIERSMEPQVMGVATAVKDNKLPQSSDTIQCMPLGRSTLKLDSADEDSDLDARGQIEMKSTAKQSENLRKKKGSIVPLLQRLKISRMQEQPARHDVHFKWSSRISKAQAKILNMDEAWQPPLPGKTLRQGTVPLDILERLTFLADAQAESMSHSTQRARPEKVLLAVRDSITPDVAIQSNTNVNLPAEQLEAVEKEDAESEEELASQWSSSPLQPVMRFYPLDSPVQQAESELPRISDLVSSTLETGHDTTLHTHHENVHMSDYTQQESRQHDLLLSSPTPGPTNQKARQGVKGSNSDQELNHEETGDSPVMHRDLVGSMLNVPVIEPGTSSSQALVTHIAEPLQTPGASFNTAHLRVGLNAEDDEHRAKKKDSVILESVERSTSEADQFCRVVNQDLMDMTPHNASQKHEIKVRHNHNSSERRNSRKRDLSELSLPDMSLLPKRKKTDSQVTAQSSPIGRSCFQSQSRHPLHTNDVPRSDPTLATFSPNSAHSNSGRRLKLPNAYDQKSNRKHEQDRQNCRRCEEQQCEELLGKRQCLESDSSITPNSRLHPKEQGSGLRLFSIAPSSGIPASSETDRTSPHGQPRLTQHSTETSHEVEKSTSTSTLVSPVNPQILGKELQTLGAAFQIGVSAKQSAQDTLCAIPSSSPLSPRQSEQAPEPAETALFRKFQETYNDYRAPMEKFVAACRILKGVQATSGLHPSLFDDFVYRYHDDYDAYLKEVVDKNGVALPYEMFYHEHIEMPQYLQRVVRKEDLNSLKFEADTRLVPVTAEEACATGSPTSRDLEQLPKNNTSPTQPPTTESGNRGRVADKQDLEVFCTPLKDSEPTVVASERSSTPSPTSLPKRAAGEASPELGMSKGRKLKTVDRMDFDAPTSQVTHPQQQQVVPERSLFAEFQKQYLQLTGKRKAASQKQIVDIFSW